MVFHKKHIYLLLVSTSSFLRCSKWSSYCLNLSWVYLAVMEALSLCSSSWLFLSPSIVRYCLLSFSNSSCRFLISYSRLNLISFYSSSPFWMSSFLCCSSSFRLSISPSNSLIWRVYLSENSSCVCFSFSILML